MKRIMTAVAVAVVLAALSSCTVRAAGTATGTSSPTEPASAETSDSAPAGNGKINTLDDVEIGDCIEFLDPSPADTEIGTIDCADKAAIYQVVTKEPSPTATCPTDHYDYYTQTGDDEFTLCYMLNAHEGDCFSGLWIGATPPERVACTDPDANAKITKVLPGTVDPNACPPDAGEPTPYPVPAPGRTICVSRP